MFIKYLISSLILILTTDDLFSQESQSANNWITIGIGPGTNEGDKELGNGLLYSIGWQKNIGKGDRFRINPNLMFGGFLPKTISDTRNQFYNLLTIGMTVHFDLIKIRKSAIVTSFGGFINNSRGLLGTGGYPVSTNQSEYFNTTYFGGNVALGFRGTSSNGNFSYVLKPVNIHGGFNEFLLYYAMVGLEIKLNK